MWLVDFWHLGLYSQYVPGIKYIYLKSVCINNHHINV